MRKSGSESLSEEASDDVTNGELGSRLSEWRIGLQGGCDRHRFVEDRNPGRNEDIGEVRNRRETIKAEGRIMVTEVAETSRTNLVARNFGGKYISSTDRIKLDEINTRAKRCARRKILRNFEDVSSVSCFIYHWSFR